jgi:hypothetical protein
MSNVFYDVPGIRNPVRPKQRSESFIRDVLHHYEALVKHLKTQSKSVELTVWVNGQGIRPTSLGAYSHECIAIQSKDSDGASLDIVPVELVSFTFRITDKKPAEPPPEIREIGFKAMMETKQ